MKYQEKDIIKWFEDTRSLAEKTITNYVTHLRHMEKYFQVRGIKNPLNELTQEMLDQYMIHLSKGTFSYGNKKIFIAAISNYLRFMENEKIKIKVLIKKTQTDFMKGRENAYLTPLIIERVRKYLNSLPEKNWQQLQNKKTKRWIFEILINTGIRRSELVNLKLDDIFIEEGFILIGGQKTMQSHSQNRIWRKVPIVSDILRNILEEIISNKWILKNKSIVKNTSEINNLFSHLATALNIKLHAHLTRHFYITKCLSDGIPPKYVANIVGDSISTILNCYYHPTHEDIAKTMKGLYEGRFI